MRGIPDYCRLTWTNEAGFTRRLFAIRSPQGWDCRIGGYGMLSRRFSTYSQSSVRFQAELLASQWGGTWKVTRCDASAWDGVRDTGFQLPGDAFQLDLFASGGVGGIQPTTLNLTRSDLALNSERVHLGLRQLRALSRHAKPLVLSQVSL